MIANSGDKNEFHLNNPKDNVFWNKEKSNSAYLKQIGGAVGEKGNYVATSLNNLPNNQELILLECGIGGGETLASIQKQGCNRKIQYIAFDISHTLVKNSVDNLGVLGVTGNAFSLPFLGESIDVINFSAIIHEIFSYADFSNQQKAIDRLRILHDIIKEASRVLKWGGFFVYRDIHLSQDHMKISRVVYGKEFSKFIRMFGKNISERCSTIFSTMRPVFSFDNSGCVIINGHGHFQRDLQRHFVTFMDYLSLLLFEIDLKFLIRLGKIEMLFSELDSVLRDDKLCYSWGKREGSETYVYASMLEIETVCLQENFTLIEHSTPERVEYSDFLRGQSSCVFPDKKQCMLLQKRRTRF